MSDDLLRKLVAARSEPAVLLREILLQISKRPNSIFCLVEGEDIPYYAARLSGSRSNTAEDTAACFVNCDGKKNVLDTFEMVRNNPEAKQGNYFVFVDADFDDNEKLPRSVYVTPCYSVENFYVSVACFERILASDVFKGKHLRGDNRQDFDRCLDLYKVARIQFSEVARLFNVWYYTHRRIKGTTRGLERVKSMELARVTLTAVVSNYTLDDLNSASGEVASLSITDLKGAGEILESKDVLLFGRGKQNIAFLRQFLLKTQAAAISGTKPFSKKLRVRMQLSKDMIREFAVYADTPTCLVDYIKRRRRSFARRSAAVRT